jgi:hypothetical protein
MERHPYFDLWLHSDGELEPHLPAPVTGRVTLHEWPLSCVQRLELADGSRRIYKAQSNEGVEGAFYRAARSPLLPDCQDLGAYADTASLLLEYLPDPLLASLDLDEAGKLQAAQQAAAAVAALGTGLPVYTDLGGRTGWRQFAAAACARLAELTESGIFQLTPPGAPGALAQWARSADVLRAARRAPALAHADLRPENIFVTPDGFKIIDWQFPRLAPPGFDLATLLEGLGLDPFNHVDAAVVKITWFTRLAWFVDCKLRLFPEGEDYDQSVAALAVKILV